MSRLVSVLTPVVLTACAAEAIPLPMQGLAHSLEATLAVAEAALSTAQPDPQRNTWSNVADLAFLPAGGGVIEEGDLRFTWRFHQRNLGLTHDELASDLQEAARALGALELSECEPTEIDIYEVETDYANEAGRFDLAMEPGAGEVLIGVYDPRSLEPGLAAIVLTPLSSASDRRALVAHELAHHAHTACHLPGNSEVFAESIEALFHGPNTPKRLAHSPSRAPAPPAAVTPEPSPKASSSRPSPVSGRPPAHARARA